MEFENSKYAAGIISNTSGIKILNEDKTESIEIDEWMIYKIKKFICEKDTINEEIMILDEFAILPTTEEGFSATSVIILVEVC